jgi:pyruvate,orthophosphate dikinase
VTGAVVLDADAAAESDGPVILVRPETSPEDVHGMSVSVGILTSSGGLVSHAAVVARGWGIPAVVGAGPLSFAAGDDITIDGTTGEVWLGRPDETVDVAASDDDILDRDLPQLARLERWAEQASGALAAAGS